MIPLSNLSSASLLGAGKAQTKKNGGCQMVLYYHLSKETVVHTTNGFGFE